MIPSRKPTGSGLPFSSYLLVICLVDHTTVFKYSLFFCAWHLGDEASWEEVCGQEQMEQKQW